MMVSAFPQKACLQTVLSMLSSAKPLTSYSTGHFWSCIGNGASFKFQLIDKHHHIKGHVEIGCLSRSGALTLNRDQVMTLETWLKIHTNVYSFVTASPKTI